MLEKNHIVHKVEMTSKFVITFVNIRVMRTIMSQWHIQPCWQTKINVNEHATKTKNVALEWCASK
jgi:hypothetical protein